MSRYEPFLLHCRAVLLKARQRGSSPELIRQVAGALHAFESGAGNLQQLRVLTKRLNKQANLVRLPPQDLPKPRRAEGVQIVQGGAPG